MNDENKTDLLSLSPAELEALMLSIGEPKYRATQIFPHLHRGLAPTQMTKLGKATREKLDAVSYCHFLHRVKGQVYAL